MGLSLFLARVWGLFAVLVSVGLLLNRKSLIDTVKHFETDSMSTLIAGVMALSIGIAQVAGYDSWTFDFKGLITLFGWLSLAKGVTIIFWPGYIERFAKTMAKESFYTTAFVIFLVLGAYLLYMGFSG